MKKLISDKAADSIQQNHSKEEIENGIIYLRKCKNKQEKKKLLLEKLIEESSEILTEKGDNFEKEIDDLIEVCKSLKEESDKFSKVGY